MWICNGCRHRPLPNQQKINDRNIESERKISEPIKNDAERPSLTRQTSEHSDRGNTAPSAADRDSAKFRINQKSRKNDPKQAHPHKTTKRSPPLGELADSGIASLSLEDPNCPVNCPIVPPSQQQQQQTVAQQKSEPQKVEKIQHSYVPHPTHSKTLQTNQL